MMGAGYCSTRVTSPSEAPGSSGAEPPLFFKESVELPHPASQSSAPLSRVPGEGKFEMI